MNQKKKTENIRKRNMELNQQLKVLRRKLKERPQTEQLILELEKIKDQWLKALYDLENERAKYNELILEMMEIKKIMRITGLSIKVPWYKKLILKLTYKHK